MIVPLLKMLFRKLPSRICNLTEVLCKNGNLFLKDHDYFYKVCTEALNKHTSRKKKNICEENKPFKNKAIGVSNKY